MAKVNLPMGYPLQSGAEAELIVYQGQLVRSYTLPNDPRSDSQLYERKFLSDASKMRGYLGAWARAALGEALGTKWASVLFQLIKSDSFSWWSDAKAEWESFAEVSQQDWRDAAPYQVTFNDQGYIFFCLVRVMVKALGHYGIATWKASEWGETQSTEALEWYQANYEWVVPAAGTPYDSEYFIYYGEWAEGSWYMNPSQLQLESSGSADDFYEFYCYSKNIYPTVRTDPDSGIIQCFIAGSLHVEIDMRPDQQNGLTFSLFTNKKRLRSVLLKPKTTGKICSIGGEV